MNVLLVTYEFPPRTATGGIGSYMLHLSHFLHARSIKVTVFSSDPNLSEVEFEKTTYGDHYYIPAINDAAFQINAADFFDVYKKGHEVDVMESPEVGACALELKRRNPGIPLIVKLHTPGVLISKISRYYEPVTHKFRFVVGALLRGKWDLGYWSKKDRNRHADNEYLLCMMAEKLLSPSIALKKRLVKLWNILESKIEVIPNPFTIHQDLYSFPINDRPNMISFIGKLSVLKGMIALTDAIPMILDQNPGCKISLAGRDEIENGKSMQAYMEEKLTGYLDRIIFCGSLNFEQLKVLYSNSQICVFPSLWENYPTVILEAMASGATVVASNSGGIPEIITHKENGLLFNPVNPTEIASAIRILKNDESFRIGLAETARDRIKTKLHNIQFENRLFSIYNSFKKE